ncbi:hypothetical protein [Flaviaesturariibacter amylovorans]|uniref:Uncharacterized protein n=1 Tax=Flaviaesturariibacter amylovorans TaxID=1084520 RepID=A0ABP8G4N9_9BACT
MKNNSRNNGSRGSERPKDRRPGGRTQQSDYWDRIANDVASGYGAQQRPGRSYLNPDQEPDDARRGDA